MGKAQTPLWSLFLGTVVRSAHGKLLLAIWSSYLAYLVALRKRKQAGKVKQAKRDTENGTVDAHNAKAKKPADGLMNLVHILRPYAFKRQGGVFAAYVLSLCTRILVTVYLSDTSGKLAAYLGSRRFTEMFRGQAWFGLFSMLAAASTAIMKFLEKQVALEVRGILFQNLKDRYLSSRGVQQFYHQDLEDASARLTSDLDDFSAELVHLTGHFLKPLIDVLYLSAVLSKRIGLQNLAIFYSFFYFSDWSLKRLRARALPQSLKQVAAKRNELEARMRSTLDGIHRYREQIAMQVGTDRERESVDKQYQHIYNTALQESQLYGVMDAISGYTLKYGGLMCAFSILTPTVYNQTAMSAEDATSFFFSNSSLLGALASAVKDIADSFSRLPKVKGLGERVWDLERRMRLVDERQKVLQEEGKGLEVIRGGDAVLFNNVKISPPRPLDAINQPVAPLCSELTFRVGPSEHTVIRGENGVGKSSMFRVLTGLWTASESGGSEPMIQVPDSLFVLPQDTYLPRGTLREQISYPLDSSKLSDEHAAELLQVVGLSHVNERYGLDSIQDFINVLSGGEKQRLGWARLYFHKPRFALADESTSAISVEQIEPCFEYAKKLGITMITISHSPKVDRQHSRAIDLMRGGNYNIKSL